MFAAGPTVTLTCGCPLLGQCIKPCIDGHVAGLPSRPNLTCCCPLLSQCIKPCIGRHVAGLTSGSDQRCHAGEQHQLGQGAGSCEVLQRGQLGGSSPVQGDDKGRGPSRRVARGTWWHVTGRSNMTVPAGSLMALALYCCRILVIFRATLLLHLLLPPLPTANGKVLLLLFPHLRKR